MSASEHRVCIKGNPVARQRPLARAKHLAAPTWISALATGANAKEER